MGLLQFLLLKNEMMLYLRHVQYMHPDKTLLFGSIDLTLGKQQKAALVGNNGAGKSTLLKIMAGELQPSLGTVETHDKPYYVPQVFGQFNALTIAQALRVDAPLQALHEILAGNVTETNLALLNDDWTIEERCNDALQYWQLQGLHLSQKMHTLSGGQKTRVFLAGISIHQPEIVLLDEPSNHLDAAGRELLYEFIRTTNCTLVVISHDRTLLNQLDTVFELGKQGIAVYGGNYDFYAAQKLLETNALNEDVKNHEKALRKAKEIARETAEKQQKLDARGKKKQEKAGLPTISMNTFKNNAEKSTARLKNVHAEKTGSIADELNDLRKALPDLDKMKFGFDGSTLHTGKILIKANAINYTYGHARLWHEPLNIEITSGERIALKGANGSGKTTLIKIITGMLQADTGSIYRANNAVVYIDQEYSLINDALTVYEQAQQFNAAGLQEHEIKIRLNRFLFTKEFWDKSCRALSGGEKMRLMLCCLTIRNQAPDIIILDEPTNNLDILNIEILTAAINDYTGTLIVVSHDAWFVQEINIQREIILQ